MTNPPQHPHSPSGQPDLSQWARPAANPQPGPDAPTQHIPNQQSNPAPDAPTQQLPPASPPLGFGPPAPQLSELPELPELPEQAPTQRRFFRDPLSIALVFIIVTALALAGLLGFELYVRKAANSAVSQAVECVIEDQAEVSFGVRPLLLQYLDGSYRDIAVHTAGNQIRLAQGMKLDLRLDDIRINKTDRSVGTLGALDATISWSNDGIQETVQDALPFLGGLVTGVRTNPDDGTIDIKGALGTVTAKPQVIDDELQLEVVKLTGLGFTLPRESVQPALDTFTKTLTKNLPMGIHADRVQVTDNGVAATFITRDAIIPNGRTNPCFSGIEK